METRLVAVEAGDRMKDDQRPGFRQKVYELGFRPFANEEAHGKEAGGASQDGEMKGEGSPPGG